MFQPDNKALPKLCVSVNTYCLGSICLLKYILSGPVSAALIVSISGVLIHILKLHVSAAISAWLNVLNSVSISFGPEIHAESYFFGLHFI